MRKKKDPVIGIWEDAREVPSAAVPNMSAVAKRAKWMRRGVKTSLILTPILIVSTIVQLGKATPEPVVETPVYAQGQAASRMAVEQWLHEGLSVIGGGEILSWNGASRTTAAKDQQSDPTTTEVNQFTVVDDSGQMYQVSVLSALDPIGGVKVIGEPSLIPIPSARENQTAFDSSWGDLPSASVNDAVSSAVKAWAKAFTSGDPDALRLAVGDETPGRAYEPLYDMNLVDTSVGTGAAVEVDKNTTTAKTMLVRVELTMIRGVANLPTDGAASPDQGLQSASYDVLIKRADTAAPAVVAWGGAGTGPQLQPYANSYPSDITRNDTPYIRGLTAESGDASAQQTLTSTAVVTSTAVTTVTTPRPPVRTIDESPVSSTTQTAFPPNPPSAGQN